MPVQPISIVLTGTITPRAIHTVHADPARRRLEYLAAIRYYAQHAPVWFLENSGYHFADDPDFAGIANVRYFEHPPSPEFNRGKGFQEFEMMDAWVAAADPLPRRFLKITGRYIVENIDDVLADCARHADAPAILERKWWPSHSARTDVACFDADFYRAHIRGAYAECDDSTGPYIENVVRQRTDGLPGIRVFQRFPEKSGINGSKGIPLKSGWRERAKVGSRNLFYRVSPTHRFF